MVVLLICRARGVVPAHGLGDPSGLAYTHLLGGPTGRGRGGGIGVQPTPQCPPPWLYGIPQGARNKAMDTLTDCKTGPSWITLGRP